MTRATLLLPIAALALTSCDTPYFAFFPEKAAKSRAAATDNPRGGNPSDLVADAYLSEIPPSPTSTDRGASDIPTYATTPSYSPDKKFTLEELTESKPSSPATGGTAPAPATPRTELEEEPQPVHWFGRPNPGNTAAIPIGPIKNP